MNLIAFLTRINSSRILENFLAHLQKSDRGNEILQKQKERKKLVKKYIIKIF